jgi:hypothetical protein
MKQKFTYLFLFLGALVFSQGASAQANGDYRTTGSGNWSALATWQVFSAGSWIAASHTPTFADGQIDILAGHTILFDLVTETVDQLVVDAGGTLTVNQGGAPVNTLVLNDGAGDDLTVNGQFNFGGTDFLTGTGNATAVVASGGTMLWTSGTLGAATTVNSGAILNYSVAVVHDLASTLTINGVMNWGIGGGVDPSGLTFDGGTFVNNGTINEAFLADHGFIVSSGVNSFANNGIFNKTSAFGFFNNTVPVSHIGTFNGTGSVNLTGANTISGTFVPGAVNGATVTTMNITNSVITAHAPNLKSYISTSGDVAGTNYDQLVVSDGGVADVSGSTLTVIDKGSDPDPIGTIYTVLSNPSGSFTGSFAQVFISPNLGNVSIVGSSVTVQKTGGTLPLTWGPFNALAASKTVQLTWSTFEEQNTSRFLVQYSSDGKNFNTIGTVAAAGNSNNVTHYSFTHTNPLLNGSNFYRLQEVDLNAKAVLSDIHVVRFKGGQIIKLMATPNPVHNLLQLNVQESGISAVLIDGEGKSQRTWILAPGTQQVNVSNLPAGLYQLVIYQNKQQIDVQHILKF